MRKLNKIAPFVLVATFIFSFILTVIPVSASDGIQRVYDNAGLLTDSEIDKLEQQAEKYSAKRDINYLIVTTDNPEELLGNQYASSTEARTEAYSDTFYTNFVNDYGNENADCTVLTIDMSNRYADVASQGMAKTRLSIKRCTQLSEKISRHLSDGNYYKACSYYIKNVNRYLGVREGIDPDSPFLALWFQALISVLIGTIVIVIMVVNTGGRMTVNQSTYLDQKNSRILARRDVYLRTTTTRVKKPETNSSGGGSGKSGGGGGNHGGSHF